jgi:nickel/cobalt transporter (NicO) family protein
MRVRACTRFAATLVALGVASTLWASGASAHPLGNLTKNTATTVVVSPELVRISAVLDLAEIPALQATQSLYGNGTNNGPSAGTITGVDAGSIDAAARRHYADTTCAELARGLHLSVDDRPSPLRVAGSQLTFPPGQGGLFTLRLVCELDAPTVITTTTSLSITDTNLGGSIGWREIVVIGDGTTISGSVSRESRSGTLTNYPDGSPERTLSATFTAAPGGGPATVGAATSPAMAQRRGSDGLTARFSDLLAQRRMTWSLAGLCALIAFILGSIHSLAPGHGKTMMAAAVVSRRGTTRQVVTIGATVAATHTTGVLALGTAIWLSQSVAPENVLPWLTVASGALVIAVGVALAARRLTSAAFGHGRAGHSHAGHSHAGHSHAGHSHAGHSHAGHSHAGHSHAGHSHRGHEHRHLANARTLRTALHPSQGDTHDTHTGEGDTHDGARALGAARPIETRWVVLMGLAGGLVPTPSALVVLLGATALGRAWFGVVLVAVYGIGMATTLLVAGVLAVRVRAWLEQRWFGATWFERAMRVAPVFTSVALVAGGALIVTRGASSL